MTPIPSDTPQEPINEDSLWKLHGLLYWLYQSIRAEEGEDSADALAVMEVCEVVERVIRTRLPLDEE